MGAGFSKNIDDRFPTLDELGEQVRGRTPEALGDAPRQFANAGFERWMSRLAEPQPYLDEVTNAKNAFDFQRISTAIHEIILDAEDRALREPLHPWLRRFVGLLHAARATVITFNYDTLLERATHEGWDHQAGRKLDSHSLLNGLPPEPPQRGLAFRDEKIKTFRLLKLHGSVDNYWVPGDASGSTIVRVAGSTGWRPRESDADLEAIAPGRMPYIVPPTSTKTAFFANPVSRQLWRTAADHLSQATHVAIVGYSVPLTDLVTSTMLAESQRRSGAHVEVVNPKPESVVKHLRLAGTDPDKITHVANTCTEYVDKLESTIAQNALRALRDDTDTESRAVVVAAQRHHARMVTGVRHLNATDTALVLSDSVLLKDLPQGNGMRVADVLRQDQRALSVTINDQTSAIVDYYPLGRGLIVLVPSIAL